MPETITTPPSRPPAAQSPTIVVSTDPAARAVAAVGLLTVGIVHVLQIHGQLDGALWLTVGFCLLAITQPVAGLWLLARPSAAAWALAGLVCLLPAVGYILTRSVAMPGDGGDVGNWLEPPGVVALITEWIVVLLAGLALAGKRMPSVLGRR